MRLLLLPLCLAGLSLVEAQLTQIEDEQVVRMQLQPRDFVWLNNTAPGPDDVDPDCMFDLEEKAISQGGLISLLSMKDPLAEYKEDEELPDGYKALRGREAAFDANSFFNQVVSQDGVDTTVFEGPSIAENSVSTGKRQVPNFGTPTSLYYCPARHLLLRWFPNYWLSGDKQEICYVPWAHRQGLTFKQCMTRTCRTVWPRNGRCRPACFQRYRVLVFCYRLSTRTWTWRWVWRALPQECRCSTC